jgi:MinD superfamily P-loop ATPase
MRVAVASGKGGTGKTTVAVSFALSLAAETPSPPPLLLDCDVEAPNAHLSLHPDFDRRQTAARLIPVVDKEQCTFCGRCAEVCQYHAIAVLGKQTLVFPQLCHGCGSCASACPAQVITEMPEAIGVLERGPALGGVDFARGVLNIGEPMAVPVIRQLKRWATPAPGQTVIVDAPPGASCPVVEATRGADYVVLVTEPTPFGLHDLRLATQLARELHLPAGVVINRDGIGPHDVEAFCRQAGLPILLRIPFERALAEGLAQGQTLLALRPEYGARFRAMFTQMHIELPHLKPVDLVGQQARCVNELAADLQDAPTD